MNPKSYPDGFPLSPLEAIEFSYFLSESEKQEWREWLQSATPEQNNELVDILHSMWQDNQKQAVPQAFNNQSNPQTTLQPVSNQAPINQAQPAVSSFSANQPLQTAPQNFNFPPAQNPSAQPAFNFAQDLNQPIIQPPVARVVEPLVVDPSTTLNPFKIQDVAPTPVQKAEPQEFTFATPKVDRTKAEIDIEQENQEVALKKIANVKYSPNPILDDNTPPLGDFVYKNGGNAQEEDLQDEEEDFKFDDEVEAEIDEDIKIENVEPEEETKTAITKTKDREVRSFFSATKTRQAGTKAMLEEIYQTYQESREKNSDSKKELDETHSEFLNKVMEVVVNFEQVASYCESIMEKTLEVNDKVINQAKEIQFLKNSTQSRAGISLQDQVDEVRDDIDQLNRGLRGVRSEQRRKYDEVSTQLASFGADTYREDGVMQKLDLMKAEIMQLQQKLSLNEQNTPVQGPKVKDVPKNTDDSGMRPEIDMRDLV